MAENEQSLLDRAKAAIDKAIAGLMPKDPKPEGVPVGDGMVDKAKKDIKGRKRAIDKALEDAGA